MSGSSSFEASSLPVGSLAGIPVRLHLTFPLVLVAALLQAGSSTWASLGWAALMYGPILLVTVLVHELGHSLAARRVGGHAEGILLWPLGGLAYVAHSSGPKADLLIALAGPLTHIPQLLFWLALLFPAYHAAYGSWGASLAIPPPSQHFWLSVFAGACQFNIGLAAFNLLLPAYPLDGGRILADVLLLSGVPVDTAARITAGAAAVLGAGVVGWGAWSASVMTAAVGCWMLYTTWQLWLAIQAGTVGQHPMFSYEEGGGGGSAETGAERKSGGYRSLLGGQGSA